MARSKNPRINVLRRVRRLYERRRKRARERREAAFKRGDRVGARRALRVIRAYAGKGQVALRKIRTLRKDDPRDGTVVVLSFANRGGASMTSTVMSFLHAVADELGDTVTVNCGTNHSKFTTSGSVSRHWTGNAADLGISWNDIEDVAAAALRVCGWSAEAARAAANRGGLYNVSWKGHRVQVIVNTYIGGNHYNHAHLGI